MTDTQKPMEQVLDQLAKLKRHEMSARDLGNEAEANAFAGRIQALLEKYHLTMDDVHLTEEEAAAFGEIDSVMVTGEHAGVGNKRRRCDWMEGLARSVAKWTGTMSLVHPGWNAVSFAGYPVQREAAAALYSYLVKFAHKASEEAYNRAYNEAAKEDDTARMRGYRASWLLGFRNRIYKRLEENAQSPFALSRIEKDAKEASEHLSGMGIKDGASIAGNASHFNSDGYIGGEQRAEAAELGERKKLK